MQNHDFRWDDARVLLALLRGGTLSAAGAQLGLNASTVSRRIEALEAALDGRLFERSPEGARPTALALRLRAHAEALELAAIGISMAAEGREVAPEGDVRIAAPPGLAEFFVGPSLPRLLARHPGLRLTIEVDTAYADLTRREADLAIRTTRPSHGDLVVQKLGDVEEALFCSKRYASEHAPLRRFDAARWITWGPELAHLPSARWIAETLPESAVVLRSNSLGTQIMAAASGLGVVVLARSNEGVQGLVEMRTTRALRRAMPPPSHQALWLVGHRAMRDVPRIAATWSFIREEAQRVGLRVGTELSRA